MTKISIRCAALVAAVTLLAGACGSGPSSEQLDLDALGETSDTATSTSSTVVTTTSTTTSTVPPTTTTTLPPVPEPDFGAAPGDGGVGCVGTRLGLSCLIGGEWNTWDRDNSPIWDWVQELDVCADGTILAPSLDGVARYRDGSWTDLGADFVVTNPNAVACGAGDELWAGFFGAVAVLQGTTWTWWDTEEVLGSTDFVKSVDDIVVAPDGTAWLVTGSSIARYDGSTWTVWEEGAGFDVSISPDAIDVDVRDDGSYTVHASIGFRGIANYDGTDWTITDVSVNGADDLEAAAGRVFVPAHQEGIEVIDGAATSIIDASMGLSSNTVRDIAFDGDGNLWAATDYGLSVLDPDGDRLYRVDNSDLIDNNAYAVAVVGSPALPADAPEPWATLAGVVLDDTGTPWTDAPVEVCVHAQRDEFDGDTPCTTGSYAATTVTDETGRFEVTALRAGRYTVAVDRGDGWTYFVDGSASAWYDAVAGQVNEAGIFTVSRG